MRGWGCIIDGGGDGNEAQVARATVVDVSLSADDPSTPSQPKPSSQNHKLSERTTSIHHQRDQSEHGILGIWYPVGDCQ